MPVPEVCLANGDIPGSGGWAGGGGPDGPGSNSGPGAAVSGKGYPVLNLVTGMKKSLDLVLYDTYCDGNIYDLTGKNVASAYFCAKEMRGDEQYYIRKQCALPADLTTGKFRINFSHDDLKYAGIWISSMVLYDAQDNIVGEWPSYLSVRKSVTAALRGNCPLSISEVRLALRDTCPEFNMLLLDVQFSDTEIAFAMTRPVDEWNESTPDVGTYSYSTFPWREFWMRATMGHLLQTAAYWYARNKLPYTAGGVAVNDLDKDQPYIMMASQLKQEWKEWMMRKKVEINASYCYGSVRARAFR